MNRKIFVLVMTLGMILSAITIPRNIDIKASDNYGDPDLDHSYVLGKTQSLAEIVEEQDWGRYFGTKGEIDAAILIEEWMNDLCLDCVHKEKIDSRWNILNEKVQNRSASLYLGKLDISRNMTEFWLEINVYNSSTDELVESKNLSLTECFPYFQHGFFNGKTGC